MNAHKRHIFIFIAILLFAAAMWLMVGCTPVPKHQQGGKSSQSLGTPPRRPTLSTDEIPPTQWMEQPENPEGPSSQILKSTTTLVHPDGTVETTTSEAETIIGGSQDLGAIIKEYVGTEHFKNLLYALLLGIAAVYVNYKGWPMAAGALCIGAVLTAVSGPVWIGVSIAVSCALAYGYHVGGGGIAGVVGNLLKPKD